MKPRRTLLLKQNEVSSLLELKDYINCVENAFKMHAEGKSLGTGLLHFDSDDLEFHIKAGGLKLSKTYFGLKAAGSSPHNQEKYGLPNNLGVIILYDGHNGYPLAIFESIEITIKRTGAATAVAAKYLARPDSRIVTICGCGTQGKIQLESLKAVLPIERAYAFDMDENKAKKYGVEMSRKLSIEVIPEMNLEKATGQSDVIVTCTPSRKYFLLENYVKPGTFVAAVGADSPEKQELEASLLSGNMVVVDILDQCARVGDLHHAIDAGLMTKEDTRGEIGEVIIGKISGRVSDDEIAIYDATGTALQDVAAAAACYEKAVEAGKGQLVNFFE